MNVEVPLPADAGLPADVVAVLQGLPPLNEFRMLANAPASSHGWAGFALSIMLQSEFDPRKNRMRSPSSGCQNAPAPCHMRLVPHRTAASSRFLRDVDPPDRLMAISLRLHPR
jgi:hypothetical protein